MLIFDNSPLYDIFTKRYSEIYEDTEDFIPETIRNQYKEEKYVFVDKSELANIKMDLVCNNEIDLSYVPKDIKETIREIDFVYFSIFILLKKTKKERDKLFLFI